MVSRPPSPLPNFNRVANSVQTILSSSKPVQPEHLLIQPSTLPQDQMILQQVDQYNRGIGKAAETGQVHTEHTYTSFKSPADAKSALQQIHQLNRFNSQMFSRLDDDGRGIFMESPRGTSKSRIAPNHNDAIGRV